MWLAGIPVADKAVLQLAASLREPSSSTPPNGLERAYDREARIVALDIPDREAILRVLKDCPEELTELRATLLQEHVWRKRERALIDPPVSTTGRPSGAIVEADDRRRARGSRHAPARSSPEEPERPGVEEPDEPDGSFFRSRQIQQPRTRDVR
jgi:hypothetical protein